MKLSELLKKHNFKFSKKYGQNFLSDGNLLISIAEKGGVNKNTPVLEIGCGAGTLTKVLCEMTARRNRSFSRQRRSSPVAMRRWCSRIRISHWTPICRSRLQTELPSFRIHRSPMVSTHAGHQSALNAVGAPFQCGRGAQAGLWTGLRQSRSSTLPMLRWSAIAAAARRPCGPQPRIRDLRWLA